MTHIYYIKGMTCGGCQATVQKELAKVDGVEEVKVELSNQTAWVTSQSEVPFSRLKNALADTHYDIFEDQDSAQRETFYVKGMSCAGCEATVRDRLSEVNGVEKISIDLKDNSVTMNLTKPVSFAKLARSLEDTHYSLHKTKKELEENKASSQTNLNPNTAQEYYCPMMCEGDKTYDKPGDCPVCGMDLVPIQTDESSNHEEEHYQKLKKKFWYSVAFTLPIFLIAMSEMLPNNPLYDIMPQKYWNWIQLALSIPVVFIFCWMFFERAWRSIKTFNFNMFTLIGIGAGIAWIFSLFGLIFPDFFPEQFQNEYGNVHVYFESATVILTLVMMGQMLEAKAHSKTSSAVKELLNLAPKNATLIENGVEKEVQIEEIQRGDKLRVKPGEKIPVDGIIIDGGSDIDESMISGEPLPVHKTIDDKVIAGTINSDSSFIMQAEKIGKETMLSQIVEMVNQASRSRAPIQNLADKISSYFVPTVVFVAVITFIIWAVWGPAPSYVYALVNAIAVLIIACPCALGLATPMSVMVGIGQGAQNGILIKQAESLERLNDIDTLIVDKTGTITEGNPSVESVHSLSKEWSVEQIAQLVGSMNSQSEHPLAKATVKYTKENKINLKPIQNFKSNTGLGVQAEVDRGTYYLGNKKLMESHQLAFTSDILNQAEKYQAKAKTVSFIANSREVIGFIVIGDKIKKTSTQAIRDLRAEGIDIYMLTGDNEHTAKSVAGDVGIDHFESGVLPQDKLEFVKKLQAQGKKVAMAGDGINDAPALAQADIGIAMGTGTDVAIESADVTLIKGDLQGIKKALNLSKAVMKNIKQNLFFALIYNTLGIPIAAGILYPFFGILLSPMIAAVAMSFSSVSVIANALRLRMKEL
ncbi:MAG: heavy metal translocating P-type ATPase [Weeksellaceae bacterium]